jgi:hypothetical protein
MKVFILSILILGLCGTVGNCEVAYDSVLVCDTVGWGWISDDSSDQGYDIHCWYNPIIYDPTISLPLCTVFVPCTVWVSPRLSDAFWLQAEKTWDEEFDEAWNRAWRRMKGYR